MQIHGLFLYRHFFQPMSAQVSKTEGRVVMKKRVLLPFEDRPYSLMYHYIAFPMGMIQGNAKQDITPWLCGRYVNCSFEKNPRAYNKFTVYPYDMWGVGEQIMFMQHILLFHRLYQDVFDDEITLMRKMLSMGYYISGKYNEEHIPGKWTYQKKYRAHDYIIFGYDDISREFISASFLRDGKFQRHTIPYENMRRALETLRTYKRELYFWKFNTEFKFELNLDRVISELSDYLNSTTSLQIYADDRNWGIEAMQRLIGNYADACERNDEIDVRYTRGIMEHKFFMCLRMEYLVKNGFLTDPSYIEKAQQTYKMAETVHMRALKYNFTRKQSLGESIQKDMNDMLAIETAYLPLVLSELQALGGGKP